jgi:hypothetical protein
VPNATLPAGETTALPFYLKNWEMLEGFQFELSLDLEKADVQKIEFPQPDLFGESNLFFKPNGKLAVSWDNARGKIDPTGDSLLFTLYLTAKQGVSVADALRLERARLSPEAYRKGDEPLAAVGLRFDNAQQVGSDEIRLQPARPNPFQEETVVPFYLPTMTEMTMTVADISGRTVLTKREVFAAGWHEWHIRRAELPGAGIYYYGVVCGKSSERSGVIVVGE